MKLGIKEYDTMSYKEKREVNKKVYKLYRDKEPVTFKTWLVELVVFYLMVIVASVLTTSHVEYFSDNNLNASPVFIAVLLAMPLGSMLFSYSRRYGVKFPDMKEEITKYYESREEENE